MNCEEVRERLLAGHADTGIADHLAGCPQCAGAAEMWTKLSALPEEQPSPALARRFDSMLAAYSEGARNAGQSWLASWWPRQPALQFAIAVSCLCVGMFAGRWGLGDMRDEIRSTRQLVAVSLLRQQSASDRLRGVSYSYRLTKPDPEVLSALLHAVRYDSSVDVRLSAVDALRRYASEPEVSDGLLQALPAPQSPMVQIALIDLIVETRERRAADLLRQLKDDKNVNEAVRERAGWGLDRL